MITIPLTQGQVTTIDDEDWDLVKDYKWCAQRTSRGTFYATSRILLSSPKIFYTYDKTKKHKKYHNIRMHLLIMGSSPGRIIDHKDNNSLNNCRDNLRFCTHSQNGANSIKQKEYGSRKPSSVYKGVTWNKLRKKWFASIVIQYKRIDLGDFKTEKEAALGYNIAAKYYRGEFAKLNEVPLNV